MMKIYGFSFLAFFLVSSKDSALKIDWSALQVYYCLLEFAPRESTCWSQVSALKGVKQTCQCSTYTIT